MENDISKVPIKQQEKILNWANNNCDNKYTDFENLYKDKYIVCDSVPDFINKHFIDIVPSDYSYIEESKKPLVLIFLYPTFFLILFYLVFNFAKKKLAKIKEEIEENKKIGKEDFALNFSYFNINFHIFVAILVLIVGLPIVVYTHMHTSLKNYTFYKLREGTINEIDYVSSLFIVVKTLENILNSQNENLYYHGKGTAILHAIDGGRLDIIKYLIEEKSYNPIQKGNLHYDIRKDSDIKHKKLILPFEYALEIKAYDIAEYLKEYLKKDEPLNIEYAAMSFDLEKLKNSINNTNYTKEEIFSALTNSIEKHDYNAMKYLYTKFADIVNKKYPSFENGKYQRYKHPIVIANTFNNHRFIDFALNNLLLKKQIYHCSLITHAINNDNLNAFKAIFTELDKHFEYCSSDNNIRDLNFALTVTMSIRNKAKKIEKYIKENDIKFKFDKYYSEYVDIYFKGKKVIEKNKKLINQK
jgi:hypothetical protein